MTRFEFAALLSHGLSMLDESEKHNVINMYISDVNRRIESGESENDAIAKFGNVDILINNILKSYDITPPVGTVIEEHPPLQRETNITKETCDEKNKDKYINKYYDIKDKFIQNKDKNKIDIEYMNKGKEQSIATRTADFFRGLWSMGINFTFTLTNLFVFVFIWMPCMAITATGVITTVALTFIMIFTGIGFWGICIAGAGCCMVGISFCTWLGSAMSRGKKYE